MRPAGGDDPVVEEAELVAQAPDEDHVEEPSHVEVVAEAEDVHRAGQRRPATTSTIVSKRRCSHRDSGSSTTSIRYTAMNHSGLTTSRTALPIHWQVEHDAEHDADDDPHAEQGQRRDGERADALDPTNCQTVMPALRAPAPTTRRWP